MILRVYFVIFRDISAIFGLECRAGQAGNFAVPVNKTVCQRE